jgi:trans-aconitate 2-methyltransferase
VGWDPAQYLKFADHRLRPAVELLARIDLDHPSAIYDLGAGAGNVTRLLRGRWPAARITGVDDSQAMLDRAAATAPDIVWLRADLATWSPPERADLIFSNAALHWLDDHARIFPALLARVAPGGVLAVQMPRNFAAASHAAIAEAARAGPWRARLAPLLRPPPVAEPARYFDWLAPSAGSVDVWETEYLQVLDGEHAVAEWTQGTALRPLLAALDEPERGAFVACYTDLVDRAYPRRADGRTLFPFRRVFIVARSR